MTDYEKKSSHRPSILYMAYLCKRKTLTYTQYMTKD